MRLSRPIGLRLTRWSLSTGLALPSAQRLHVFLLVPALLLAVAAARAGHTTQADRRQDAVVFPILADGANARVSQRWTLRRPDRSGLGLIVRVVRCNDTLFLADSEYRVYRFDLRHPGPVQELVSDPAVFGLPRSLATDCDHQKLYVVTGGSRMLVTVDARSGAIERTQ